ncbi:MAG: alpha/beta hydrolase [Clostridia bacterium]|nr:alpha/beta hydrolase [Clostridia bacterium]MBP5270874.1 alpha/beta hydrolase [Clostridia bacterium]
MKLIWFKVKYNSFAGGSLSDEPETVTDRYEEGISEAVLSLPDSYSEEGCAVPLIFCAHGSGGRVCEAEDARGGLKYLGEGILSRYAAFDIHGTRPDGRSYGNRRYCEAVNRAYETIVSEYNVERRLFVSGASMGGICALNFVNLFPNIVKAIGLFYPRTNLHGEFLGSKLEHGSFDAIRDAKKDFWLREVIADQYGFSQTVFFEKEKTAGLDPWNNRTVVIDGKRYSELPCPIKIWHGDADVSVEYRFSAEYIAALRRRGCYAELRRLRGRGHKINSVMQEELGLWFDRFAR